MVHIRKALLKILKMMNPKQFEKLLNNPKYQGQVSSEAPEGLDKIIQDMMVKQKQIDLIWLEILLVLQEKLKKQMMIL